MESSEGSKYYREHKPDLFWQSYIECFWEFHIPPEIINEPIRSICLTEVLK